MINTYRIIKAYLSRKADEEHLLPESQQRYQHNKLLNEQKDSHKGPGMLDEANRRIDLLKIKEHADATEKQDRDLKMLNAMTVIRKVFADKLESLILKHGDNFFEVVKLFYEKTLDPKVLKFDIDDVEDFKKRTYLQATADVCHKWPYLAVRFLQANKIDNSIPVNREDMVYFTKKLADDIVQQIKDRKTMSFNTYKDYKFDQFTSIQDWIDFATSSRIFLPDLLIRKAADSDSSMRHKLLGHDLGMIDSYKLKDHLEDYFGLNGLAAWYLKKALNQKAITLYDIVHFVNTYIHRNITFVVELVDEGIISMKAARKIIQKAKERLDDGSYQETRHYLDMTQRKLKIAIEVTEEDLDEIENDSDAPEDALIKAEDI